MYRLMLLCYAAQAFCKTIHSILFHNKTHRRIKKLKFFSAALRTGCFNRHKRLIGLYADIDSFFDLYAILFNPPVLNNMPLVIALTEQLYTETAAWEAMPELAGHKHIMLTTMHSRLLYFNMIVLFFALVRRDCAVYAIGYDNFLRSMIEQKICIRKTNYFYTLSPEIKKTYALPGDIYIALISEQHNNAVGDILSAIRGDTHRKQFIFAASDIAISAPKHKKNTFRFLNVDIAPKRGVSFFQRRFHCPVVYVRLSGSLRNRHIAECTVFPYHLGKDTLLPQLYALFERYIKQHPLHWTNWTNFLTMQIEPPPAADYKQEKIYFRTKLVSPSRIRQYIAVTKSGRILIRKA
ncbi:MAG: hypothetical protein ACTTJ7_04670 [Treponema sp.]